MLERAYDRSLSYLSFRPRSCHEIAVYLRRKGFDINVVEHVLNRLARVGLVNDFQFALYWTTNRSQFSPRGRRALRAELHQKGVDRESIESALDASAADDLDHAIRAARKRAKSIRDTDPNDGHRKLLAFLARRGFRFADAHRAVAVVLSERQESDPS
jgi:regulatory protein